MKKNALSLLLSIMAIATQAQYFTNTRPGFIGLNTNNATSFLTIDGNEIGSETRTFLKLNNRSDYFNSFVGLELAAGSSSYKTVLQHVSSSYYMPGLDGYANFGQLYSRGAGLILRAGSGEYPTGVIKFMTGLTYYGGSWERMRISSGGNIGIGDFSYYNPKSKLHIQQGDVYVDDSTKGIILTSPNGSCWRVTVDDWGNLNRVNITCPN